MIRYGLVKSFVLKAISLGVKVPEGPIDRYIELTHLKELLALLKINCVFDVGANEGQFASELRAIGYDDYIVSFEPVQHVFDTLSQKFSQDPKWKGFQVALGSKNETANINVHEMTVMSSLLESKEHCQHTKTQTIEVKRIDEMLPTIVEEIPNPRIFLKMDTQGYDLEAFKGAQQCLGYIQGLQSEISVQPLYKGMPHYNESLTVYEKHGFELFNISVVNRISSGGLLELNAFMKRRSVSN